MLILNDLLNQRSNQFIQFIHLSAFCKKHIIEFCHPPFIRKYESLYPGLQACNCKLSFSSRLYVWYKLKIHSKSFLNLYDDDSAEYYANNPGLLRGKYVLCKGGRLRDNASVTGYRNYYKDLFKPGFDTQELYKDFLQKDSPDQNILGVHIRRTDYVGYEGGMYYFGDDIYISYIKQAINLLGENTKIILFTDDKNLDIPKYEKEFSNILISRKSVAEDYYLMGQCDYLLSTNSTFTLVASYLGRCWLFRFFGIDEEIKNLSVFRECETLNHTGEEAARADVARKKYKERKN